MSLLADAECPKVAFENVELKDKNENGKTLEVGKKTPGDRCRSLFRDHKVLVLLICLIVAGIVIGIVLGFVIGQKSKGRVISEIPTDYRLPGNLIPTHYVLEVRPYIIPRNFTFDGKVEILARCVQRTDKVILHSKGLTIEEDEIRIRKLNQDYSIKVSDVEYNKTMSFLILHLSEDLEENQEYLIFLSFNAKLQRGGKGFYVSSYYDEVENIHYTASTQYEAIHAREGFPCFDEPAYKATFDITIVRWKNMSSLSNMPRIKTQERGKYWVADTFLTTLKMSTYIVAYYIGEYVGKVENKVRVWAPRHKADLVDFSLDLANKVLPYFEDIIGIPYVPPKMDMIPVSALVAAAMENWGLIVYTTNQLLYDKDRRSAEKRQIIAVTVTHEIAHQWFGNLVTPKWWSDIWLSEGMTTYMENIASMHLFPEWNEIDKSVKVLYSEVFDADCTVTRPLPLWRNLTAEEITLPAQTFGSLTYMKGAMISRMLHYILGNETFWRGIKSYLQEYSYDNVEEKDLWRHLTKAQLGKDKIDMEERMWSWTHHSGSPTVTVTRDYDKRTATLTQYSCKARTNATKRLYGSDLWHVPISYSTPRHPSWNSGLEAWLTEREMTMKDLPKKEEWILINGNSMGYYLVNYDKRNWELLAEQLRNDHEVFSPDQRYKILADANMLYKFGSVDVIVPLDVSSYLGNERVLSVLSYPNIRLFEDSSRDMEYSAYGEYWMEFVISILAPIEEILGWETDLDTELVPTRQLRTVVNSKLCEMNHQSSVNEAVRRFYVFRDKGKNQTLVTMHNRRYILCAAIRSGPWDVTEYFLKHYENNNDERLILLTCSENQTIIEYIFDILDDGWSANHYAVISGLMRNRMYWRKYLEFLDNYLDGSTEKDPLPWIVATRRGLLSQEQRKAYKDLSLRHVSKIPNDEEREVIERELERKDWEDKKEENVRIIGEWLEKRLWA